MAKPLVAVETIYDTALRILDEQGAEGLNARNLAATLQCSTRTLYQQVGKREALIRQLLDYYFSSFQLDFKQQSSWRDSARAWAYAMRMALLAHPNLSRLITVENRGPIADYVTQLLKVLLQEGFDEELALRSCRVLIHVVLSLSLAEIETPAPHIRRRQRSRKEIEFEDLIIARGGRKSKPAVFQDTPEVFQNAINWIIKGVEDEVQTKTLSQPATRNKK